MKQFFSSMLAIIFMIQAQIYSVKTLQVLTQKKIADLLVNNKTHQLISDNIKNKLPSKSNLEIIELVLPKEQVDNIKQEIVDKKCYQNKTLYQEIGESIDVDKEIVINPIEEFTPLSCDAESRYFNPLNKNQYACLSKRITYVFWLTEACAGSEIELFDVEKNMCIKTIIHRGLPYDKLGFIDNKVLAFSFYWGAKLIAYNLNKLEKSLKNIPHLSFGDTIFLYQFFSSHLQRIMAMFKTNVRKENIMQQLLH